jgi:thiamine-phosphate pyrophosphorylase
MFDEIDIYPVINSLEVLEAAIAGGARVVQLRDKEKSKREFSELAKKFREITAQQGVMLIINDHVDVAAAVEADGVHLGQGDMPAKEARKLAPQLIIGVSTHNEDEAVKAEKDGADYINIGPIFKTRTKDMEPIGIESIKGISSGITIPFTVMGGINLGNLDQVLGEGARRIAVVSAITEADDPAAATREFKRRIRKYDAVE